jgi:hypothetical protein
VAAVFGVMVFEILQNFDKYFIVNQLLSNGIFFGALRIVGAITLIG